jgi:hypothetical protein
MQWRKWMAALSALLLIGFSFLPWIRIESRGIMLTGVNDMGLDYGPRGMGHVYFGVICLLLLLVRRNWAMLFAILVAAINIAFAFSHFYVYRCSGGICPEKLYGLYLSFGASALMLGFLLFSPVNPDKPEKNE